MTKKTGLLTIDELKSLVQAEEVETILVVFTDIYGRFMGKRYDADFFIESRNRARSARVRLSSDCRYGDGACSRLQLRELGSWGMVT